MSSSYFITIYVVAISTWL